MKFTLLYKNDKKTMYFGKYKVVEEKKGFCAIYEAYSDIILTHRKSWASATKTALLLYKAYKDGYEDASDNYRY